MPGTGAVQEEMEEVAHKVDMVEQKDAKAGRGWPECRRLIGRLLSPVVLEVFVLTFIAGRGGGSESLGLRRERERQGLGEAGLEVAGGCGGGGFWRREAWAGVLKEGLGVGVAWGWLGAR